MSKAPMIAIIDDDESVRESTKELVSSLGYMVHTFASAEDFLSSDYCYNSSCIITDVQMKGLSGVELQERLIAEGHRLPIIFVTALCDEETASCVVNAGAIGCLGKPVSDKKLIHYLDIALEKSNSRSAGQGSPPHEAR